MPVGNGIWKWEFATVKYENSKKLQSSDIYMRRMEFLIVKPIPIPAMRRDIRVHRAQCSDVVLMVVSIVIVVVVVVVV